MLWGRMIYAHPLQIVEALCLCGLELTLGHRLNGGTDDLAHIRTGINAQRDDAGADHAQAQAGKGQCVVQKAQLQQQRRLLSIR